MEILPQHVAYTKKIGNLKGMPVMETATTGGYHLITVMKNGQLQIIGLGPISPLARFVARKREPELEITELKKGDYIDPSHYIHLVPKYEEETVRVRKLQGL